MIDGHADGYCPQTCLTDDIRYTKMWDYDIRTGAYTLMFDSHRNIVSVNPGNGTRIVSISQNGGTKPGTQTVQVQ